MALKVVVGGWYKWERLHWAKGRSSKYHVLVRISLRGSRWIGWTACGVLIPKPKYCRNIYGPLYGGEEKPCQNCVRSLVNVIQGV